MTTSCSRNTSCSQLAVVAPLQPRRTHTKPPCRSRPATRAYSCLRSLPWHSQVRTAHVCTPVPAHRCTASAPVLCPAGAPSCSSCGGISCQASTSSTWNTSLLDRLGLGGGTHEHTITHMNTGFDCRDINTHRGLLGVAMVFSLSSACLYGLSMYSKTHPHSHSHTHRGSPSWLIC